MFILCYTVLFIFNGNKIFDFIDYLIPDQTPLLPLGGEGDQLICLKTYVEPLHSVKNTIKKVNLVRKFVSEWSLSISRSRGYLNVYDWVRGRGIMRERARAS